MKGNDRVINVKENNSNSSYEIVSRPRGIARQAEKVNRRLYDAYVKVKNEMFPTEN